MPYTFTSWTACTDPAGNARTLDWTASGMKGQPAAIYLEALRQAAALRIAVLDGSPSGFSHPDELPLGAPIFNRLSSYTGTLLYLDEVCWTLWPQTGGSYYSGAYAWITADATPMYQGAETTFLSGGAARIAGPAVLTHGQLFALTAAYLRQLKGCLQAKTRTVSPAPDYTIADYASGWALGS